ncbi:MAG: hypothetical protein SFZ24_09190 [Planctomycetota bacterium]|nr:hypothetical protein [Planctomycetota bacterium]
MKATRIIIGTCLAALALPALVACNIAAGVGYMIESYKRDSTHVVPPEYTGLAGKSFALIVTGDRVLQGSWPTLFPRLTARMTDRLVENQALTQVTGVVPAVSVVQFQLENPNWVAWPFDKVAEELGVERLIVVEMYDYRLNEPGNAYLWDAVAAARVGVIEVESPTPSEFVFQKELQVKFPDERGQTPEQITQQQVQANIDKRITDRVTWLFYEHDEPYYPEY